MLLDNCNFANVMNPNLNICYVGNPMCRPCRVMTSRLRTTGAELHDCGNLECYRLRAKLSWAIASPISSH